MIVPTLHRNSGLHTIAASTVGTAFDMAFKIEIWRKTLPTCFTMPERTGVEMALHFSLRNGIFKAFVTSFAVTCRAVGVKITS
jgi:hypothetical protein